MRDVPFFGDSVFRISSALSRLAPYPEELLAMTFFLGGVILWKAFWLKGKHCFSRLGIWGVTRVYCEQLSKLCLVYLGE